MRTVIRFAAIVAAVALPRAPALSQTLVKDSALPAAATLTGAESLRAVQGSGCPTSVSPCANVRVTPAQIATYLAPTFQANDADLTAIAALSTTPFGRSLLTMPDAPSTRAAIGVAGAGADTTYLYRSNNLSDLGSVTAARSNLGLVIGTTIETWSANLDALAALTGTNTIYYRSGSNAWSPVVLGPNFAFSGGNLTIPGLPISISGDASGSSSSTGGAITLTLATVPIGKGGTGATTASAALAAIGGQPSSANLTAIAGLATATDNCSYWSAAATAALYNCPSYGRSLMGSASASAALSTLGLGSAALAPTGTSGHALGYLDGSNTYSGPMTFLQAITGSITGNAATATRFAGSPTINGVTFTGASNVTINAVDSTARLGVANNLSDVASPSAALANIGGAPLASPAFATKATAPQLVANGSSQSAAKIVMAGQEFYQAGNSDTNGPGLIALVNRSNNRQACFVDTGNMTVNSTNLLFCVRLIGTSVSILALATDGQTALPLTIGSSAKTIIGANLNLTSVPAYATDSAAGNAGLVKGDIYQTTAGVLMVKQ